MNLFTYDGLTIGLPFITPIASEGVFINNRSIAHHLGSYGFIGKWNHKTKMSYVTNRGTYGEPIEAKQKQLLMATTWVYSTQKYGELSFYGGIDFLNDQDNRFGGGLGYKYIFK